MLGLEADLEVVGVAYDGASALRETERLRPDVLVTDIEMPHMTGLELAAELKRLKSATRTIIVTTFARPGYLRRAIDAGVLGYLLKDGPAAELASAIRRVHAGERVVDPVLALDAWSEPDPLSDRERAVLRLAAEGLLEFGHRRAARALRWYGTKLSERSDWEDGRFQSHRSRAHRARPRLALERQRVNNAKSSVGAL